MAGLKGMAIAIGVSLLILLVSGLVGLAVDLPEIVVTLLHG